MAVLKAYDPNTATWYAVVPGAPGKSAYEIAVEEGYSGTVTEFLDSLVGSTGPVGDDAYQVWLSEGNLGTEQDFLDSLIGPQGPQGIQGEQGPQGIQGIQGDTGPQGIQGDTGPQGIQGIQGDPGPAGADGADGAVWRDGTGVPSNALGVDGDYYLDNATGNVYVKAAGTYSVASNITGPQGPQGIQGDTGPQGIQGIQGETGATGPQGDTGPQGPQGIQGVQGDTGPAGADGADGADGSVWREGTGAPSDALGVDGDLYLDDATGDVYQRASGTYSVVANITGPQGATGPAGADGADGADGLGVPDPSAQPDGKMLETLSGALVYVDPPAGGGGGISSDKIDGPWSPGSVYDTDHVVTHADAVWVAIEDGVTGAGNEPSNTPNPPTLEATSFVVTGSFITDSVIYVQEFTASADFVISALSLPFAGTGTYDVEAFIVAGTSLDSWNTAYAARLGHVASMESSSDANVYGVLDSPVAVSAGQTYMIYTRGVAGASRRSGYHSAAPTGDIAITNGVRYSTTGAASALSGPVAAASQTLRFGLWVSPSQKWVELVPAPPVEIPDDAGSTTGDVLTTDGAGTYTWETVAAGGGASTGTAQTVTASLADDASETGTVSLADFFTLYTVASSVAARVTLYASDAYRTADSARPIGTDPTGDHGVILDVAFTPSMLSLYMAPFVSGYISGGAVFYRITNLSGGASVVTIDYSFIDGGI